MQIKEIIETVQQKFNYSGPIHYAGKSIDFIDISGLTEQSQLIEKDWLFAALPGSNVDGITYLDQALSQGANCVLTCQNSYETVDKNDNTAFIIVENPRQFFSWIVSIFYSQQPHYIAGVTGTNGKTSTARFTEQIWTKSGINAASLGTLGLSYSEQISGIKSTKDQSSLTTPGPSHLHLQLSGLAQADIQHVVMEASSHGLKQYRLDGIRVKAAAFTNLSHDHLDYHPDMEDYFLAKLRLFTDILEENGAAILNNDDPYTPRIIEACKAKNITIWTYGKGKSDLQIISIKPLAHGMKCQLNLWGNECEIDFPLIGEFQLYNALAAMGLSVATNEAVSKENCASYLSSLRGIRGRLQQAGKLQNGASIYVDFAHTPDALEQVIHSLKPHCAGQLWVLFGCGGNRDPEKRPVMGEIGHKLADHVVITDDNPRHEDPAEIRKQILQSCPNAKEIADRKRAIWNSIHELGPGDILLIAGKGHEPGQIIGDRVIPFDDADEARKAIEAVNVI